MGKEADNQPPVLNFPCDFVIKAFGVASDEFEATVITIIRSHVENLKENSISTRPSKDGKYLAITINAPIQSREQLDNIYRDLSSNPLVLMAL